MADSIEIDRRKLLDQRERLYFEQAAEQFFKRWSPTDPYDAAQFNAEFFTLVRQIYRDAIEPMSRQMAEVISTLPMASLFEIAKSPEKK